MKNNFCTYFDKNYAAKGITLYYSLLAVCEDFVLWVLCLDNEIYSLLRKMALNKINLIRLEEIEDEPLLKAKNNRSILEYYFTVTPSLPLYILKRQPLIDMITYVDADIFFFSDPAPIFKEFGNKSIMITEHHYAKSSKKVEKWNKKWGKYNVQFVTFRNDANAKECLEWWRARCNEWCYCRHEVNLWADQKYLDSWPERFKGVHVLEHKGGGLALWNIGNYNINKHHHKIYVDEDDLIFYHFHQFAILNKNRFILTSGFKLAGNHVKIIYEPYIRKIKKTIDVISKVDPDFYKKNLKLCRAHKMVTFIDKIKEIVRILLGKIIKKYYYVYSVADNPEAKKP